MCIGIPRWRPCAYWNLVCRCFTTLVATRRRRCLLRSVRVNVMPEWLLSVISGILAGGIPGFCSELCCFLHPFSWPLRVVPCCLRFASFSVAILMMTHTRCHRTPPFSELVAIPLLCGLVWFWFCCGFGCFVCLFAFCLFVFYFDGTAHWTVYWSITSTFEAIDV